MKWTHRKLQVWKSEFGSSLIKLECTNLVYIGVADSTLCWILSYLCKFLIPSCFDWLIDWCWDLSFTHTNQRSLGPPSAVTFHKWFCHHMRVRIDVKSLTLPHTSQQLSTNGHPPGTCYITCTWLSHSTNIQSVFNFFSFPFIGQIVSTLD